MMRAELTFSGYTPAWLYELLKYLNNFILIGNHLLACLPDTSAALASPWANIP